MKPILLVVLSYFFYGFAHENSFEYYIYNIDSVSNHYIVHARIDSTQFKILSPKKGTHFDSVIQVGWVYNLHLEGYFRKFVPANAMMSISGLVIDKTTYLRFE